MNAVMSSPPYAGNVKSDYLIDAKAKTRTRDLKRGFRQGAGCFRGSEGYGGTDGQLGRMRDDDRRRIEEQVMNQVEVQTWENCYDDSWKCIICPEAFAHPAKMARGLLCRILDYGLSQGFWKKGDTILDPFGGVGTTGIEGANRGMKAVCCELEPRFVALGWKNFQLHRRVWEQFGDPLPVMVEGDSRKLAGTLEAAGLISSPPYAETLNTERHGIKDERRTKNNGDIQNTHYGTTPGNMGNMPPGGLVSSPPYAGIRMDGSINDNEGGFRPYSNEDANKWHTQRDQRNLGNLGEEKNVNRETFWGAAELVVRQCHLILPPGAVSAWVVKNFVRDRKIVDFSGDWAHLLTQCGFEVFLEVRASLVKETTEAGLFGEVKSKKERKSFFRRLQEKKGSPEINHETVWFARRKP